MKTALDPVNVRLLDELQKNPRMTMSELGRRLDMSSPAVTDRVQRLEDNGIITGYRLELDPRGSAGRWRRSFAFVQALDSSTGSPTLHEKPQRSWSVIASRVRTAF